MEAPPPPESPDGPSAAWLALALSLGAAVSLGVTRFAYGLLLPTMRADLGWTYTLAGAMNTSNAAGYLAGALLTPRLLRATAPAPVLWGGALVASLLTGVAGFLTGAGPLLVQRFLAGVVSALVFVAGGLMAARLAVRHPARSGFLLGLYYGGVGLGIATSALAVPVVLEAARGVRHGWAWAWWVLAALCLWATGVLAWPARALRGAVLPAAGAPPAAFRWGPFAFSLAGYGMFGAGYIGYMTFVVALLRERGASGPAVTAFYALLGLAVVGSSRVWAGLLDRAKGGGAQAFLSALLALATALPAFSAALPVVLLSGLLFGLSFLSVVASTTALVRHNLPQPEWAAGISAFTIAFAVGHVVGPVLVGKIADGPGGLARGLLVSAGALAVGAALAARQRALGS